MKPAWPKRLVVWPEAIGGEGLPAMLRRSRGREVLWVDEGHGARLAEEEGTEGRNGDLHLKRLVGPFLVPCPGTKGYLCCGYEVLRVGENCNFECAYCVLPQYFRGVRVVAHVNWGRMWHDLERRLCMRGFCRVGTGEFTDSLSWDHAAGLAPRLVRFFSTRENALLELKTKSAAVDELALAEPQRGTVVSWSLNPPEIVRAVEHGTASLDARLRAARDVARWGYAVGFHFDPLIWYPGWEAAYRSVVSAVFRSVRPSSVIWISLGTLRFPGSSVLRPPSSVLRRLVAHAEWVRGRDGKRRYYEPMRVEMYSALASSIREIAGEAVPVYLCMESPEVWRQSLNWTPEGSQDVAALLNRAAIRWRRGNSG